ncbi:MAG: GNAT family N-acetyltransferase [Calothrix sp. SM1_5_4]|nr:GNAT family N-acetyltransferase [Calothrix sp. SM1_5_4]
MIREGDSFLSAAVMKPLVIKSPAGLFKAAAIGSVVTSPECRNQGLSRRILEDCLSSARAHGCDFAILWTNLFDFYRKLGFELGGTELSLSVPPDLKCAEAPDPLRFMESSKVDPEAILRLYSQHTTGSIRTVEDIRRFLLIPNSRVFTAWDAQNRLQAYAVEGKGADLDGYIHEWGGGVSKLLPLLRFAAQSRGRALNLIAPAHSSNLIRQLKAAGCPEHSGVLGMIKILNPAAFLLKIKKYVRGMGLEDVVLEPRDGKFYMGYREEIFSTDQESDLVRLVFGPLKASQLHPFDRPTADAFERLFPIAMWIWGWDSV